MRTGLVLTAIALARLCLGPAEAVMIRAGVTARPKLCYLSFRDI
ncbi:hypothetical protein [Bradyrhizobium sediminis]|nr:hypothetical protein [Bradyrhizobium sediminis]